MTRPTVAALGVGRMGRGIALVFAWAGHEVRLIDLKPRPSIDLDRLRAAALAEIAETLEMLAALGVAPAGSTDAILARITVSGRDDAADRLAGVPFVFEGVPETLAAKREAMAAAAPLLAEGAILASTTSTILADDLQPFAPDPAHFLNAHWLNPAYLVPLVEVSPGAGTDPAATTALCALLESVGKVPVVCKASPGYIVPRIQMLAMNEAARLVEEGVASAEDVDKAVRYGFGLRFGVLGLLEFIDWGGGDILAYASRYMAKATGEARFAAPEIVERNMREGRIGMAGGEGFFDWRGRDVAAYRRERLARFVAAVREAGCLKPPVL